MKIESLTLKDFRSHESSHIAFSRLTFLTGKNAAGKSSVAGAIEWLLTGLYAGVTDDGGRGSEALLRKGMVTCSSSAEVRVGDEDFFMCRSRTNLAGSLVVSRKGYTLENKPANEWLAKRLPPMQVLSALANSSRFLDMPIAQQKKLLSQVLTDDGIPVPDDIRKDTDVPERVTISELDHIYKAAYERRTEVNRTLKQYENLAAPAETNLPTIEGVQGKLAQLRKERDAAVATRANLISEAQTLPKHRSALETQIARLKDLEKAQDRRIEAHRKDLESQIEALSASILPMKEEKRLKTVVEAGPATESITDATRVKLEEANEKKTRIVQLGAKAACSMCTRALSKQGTVDLLKILDAHIKNLTEQIDRSVIEDEKRKVASEASEAIKVSISAVFQKEQLEKELIAGPEVDPQISAQLQAAETEFAGLPEQVGTPDTSEIDAQIAAFDERIAKGEKVLLQVNEKRRELAAYETASKARAGALDELTRLEKVLAFAGPDGARKQAAAGKIGAFTESLNAALGQFGFAATFTLEPFAMRVGTDGQLLDVSQLSESERFRFSVAFQIALAKVTGVDLVIIDRADVLDKTARKMLTAMLLESGIGQAIVCSTTTEPVPERLPDGVRFVQLAQVDGVTRVVSVSPAQAVAA